MAKVGAVSTLVSTDQNPFSDSAPEPPNLKSLDKGDTASVETLSDCFVSLPDSGEWPFSSVNPCPDISKCSGRFAMAS